ncbi:endonuclease/exonuclease/phosphatase family protein [bacterium]|nr:endonuclease/exonuclease/phosphatase family protein [bacterium]
MIPYHFVPSSVPLGFFIVMIGMAGSPTTRATELELKVVTYNVLVEISSGPGIPAWKDRREALVQLLENEKPDLIALQEPTPRQLAYLAEKLASFGSVQDQKFTDAALFYRKDLFEIVDQGHWWLSPTPDKPMSRGFGNFLPRILVWARLKHRASGGVFVAACTHFDNTTPSQTKMAALCQEKWKPFRDQGKPIIWMGDFNTDQGRGDYPMLVSNGFHDAYTASPLSSPGGRDDNASTFPGENGKRIDHILYFGAVRATEWRVIPYEKTILSDHYPVAAKLVVTLMP